MSRRRVSFPPNEGDLHTVVCTVPHRGDYDEFVIAALFFSRDEHQAARSSARAAVRSHEGYGQSKLLDGTFSEKSPDLQEKLNRWAEVADLSSQRGLERWANEDHGDGRNQAQFHAIMAVLGAQEDMLRRGREVDMEKLRKVSTKATRKARHFARMMGKADSFCVMQELRHDPGECDASQLAIERVRTDASPRKEDRTVAIAVTSDKDKRALAVVWPTSDGSLPELDEIDSVAGLKEKDGQQEKARSRRFGFGRKNRDTEAYVSRVA
jgi:hypothetical protein